MANKTKTNEQALRSLLKALTPVESALVRERLVTILQQTSQSVQENPEEWKNFFVHPSLYVALWEKAKLHIGLD